MLVELSAGNVTMPDAPKSWSVQHEGTGVVKITMQSAQKTLDLRFINTLEGIRRKYRYFVMPINLRFGEVVLASMRQGLEQVRAWTLEKEFIQNTI